HPTTAELSHWKLVLAFDMQVSEDDTDHLGLNQTDVTESAICSLAYLKRDNAQFLNQGWVSAWLKTLWNNYYAKKENQNKMPRRMVDDDSDPGTLELGHLACYLVYLKLLKQIIGQQTVRIAKIEEDNKGNNNFINVDLVLDIGNSRTTGILVEHLPEGNTESLLNNCYRLHLRDMSKPYLHYKEPFETKVEFAKTEFGLSEYSDRSERANAFTCTSAVRTGPEATRLAALSINTAGSSGMSSPKRFLWDQEESEIWYFNKSQTQDTESPVSSLALCRFVNNFGIPIVNLKEIQSVYTPSKEGQNKPSLTSIALDLQNIFGKEIKDQTARFAQQPKFVRSSMMMFLFIEIIQQALLTINAPQVREQKKFQERPRRLASIIFTVPPGMPSVEKTIYGTWCKAAVEVFWSTLGWQNFYQDYDKKLRKKDGEVRKPITDFRNNPDVKCQWDEATCTQLVYVYNEIKHNYAYDAHLFFEIVGKKRSLPSENNPNQKETKPSLRVATIDIGGGTTDISITTFVLANDQTSTNRIWPRQEITDGFSIGGDDVLRKIITHVLLPFITDALVQKGLNQNTVSETLRTMFTQKSSDIRIQNLRTQFVRQVLMPAALSFLAVYENLDLHSSLKTFHFLLNQIFLGYEGKTVFNKTEAPSAEIIHFFNQEIADLFHVDFDILTLEGEIAYSDIDEAILSVLENPLNNLGELVHAYNCDILLLSGRPSCWNAIVRHIFSIMCISADRVIPMRNYRVGPWYRFADTSGRIIDPKTTVVMGAVLCQLAENSLEGFVFNSSRLKIHDTARF
ncbi:MAG: virulence factor SrfB, partial [Desulfovibrio sp.]|nr:virulence factor SrfB [Desulfovibrio sp.]